MFLSENGIIYKIMFYSIKDLNVEVTPTHCKAE